SGNVPQPNGCRKESLGFPRYSGQLPSITRLVVAHRLMFVTLMPRYDPPMAETAWTVDRPTAVAARADAPRHAALVRVTHWLTTVCFLALLVSGLEILVSHPRFYWGETGNVLTPVLFSLPIPASRATVPTGYGFVLPDQNGWSRYLHFQSAWVLVLTGALYVIWGAVSGHFRKHLLPDASDRSVQALSRALARHLRFARPVAADAWSYNLV